MFRIHPRTREFQIFCEGTSNPVGNRLRHRGERVRLAPASSTTCGTWSRPAITTARGAVSAVHLEDRIDRQAQAPEGGLLRPALFRQRRLSRKVPRKAVHGEHSRQLHQLRQAGTATARRTSPRPSPISSRPTTPGSCPSSQKTGPDGCLYILDWYDQYHCYQDARRDPAGIERAKGRLYRVRYKDTPRAAKFDLAKETDDQLIERLGSPNVYFRDIAQRLLAERNSPCCTAKKLTHVLSDEALPRKDAAARAVGPVGHGRPRQSELAQATWSHRDDTFSSPGASGCGERRRNPPHDDQCCDFSNGDWSSRTVSIDPSPDVTSARWQSRCGSSIKRRQSWKACCQSSSDAEDDPSDSAHRLAESASPTGRSCRPNFVAILQKQIT